MSKLTEEEFTRLIWSLRVNGTNPRSCHTCKHMVLSLNKHCRKFSRPNPNLGTWAEIAAECEHFTLGSTPWLAKMIVGKNSLAEAITEIGGPA